MFVCLASLTRGEQTPSVPLPPVSLRAADVISSPRTAAHEPPALLHPGLLLSRLAQWGSGTHREQEQRGQCPQRPGRFCGSWLGSARLAAVCPQGVSDGLSSQSQSPCCSPVPSHCPCCLTVRPEITSHTNHLGPGPHFRGCFWGTQNKHRGSLALPSPHA